jgi:hypothetical protein
MKELEDENILTVQVYMPTSVYEDDVEELYGIIEEIL